MKMGQKSKNKSFSFESHPRAKIFNLKIAPSLFFILFFLWVAGFAFSAYIISRHINYKITLQYNKFLESKTKNFAKEVVQAKEAVKRISGIDGQMRDLLQLKSKKSIIRYTGFGGPAYIDSDLLEKNIKNDDEIVSTRAFELVVKYVNEEAERNEKSFQEIVGYITDQRAKLTAVPSGWPVKGWITCGFGSRIDPMSGVLAFHYGVDIASDEGAPVKAPADGVVISAKWGRDFGNMVLLNHGNGYTTRYGHMQKYIVSVGQQIKKGQIIGYVGTTGRSTNPHLHYEVRLNSVAVNPVKYLNREVALK